MELLGEMRFVRDWWSSIQGRYNNDLLKNKDMGNTLEGDPLLTWKRRPSGEKVLTPRSYSDLVKYMFYFDIVKNFRYRCCAYPYDEAI